MKPSGLIRLIVPIVMVIGGLMFSAGADRALAAGGGDVCLLPLAGCGDGVCDPYFGETAASCPADCAPPPPPPPATSTLRPTATRIPAVVAGSPTPTLSGTGGTETGPTPTPTATATPLPTATPGAVVCDLVDFDTLPEDWQGGYLELSEPTSFTAEEASDLLVMTCPVPPSGEVCLPLSESLRDAVDDDTGEIRLVECTDDGRCRTLRGEGQQIGDALCFELGTDSTFTCDTGCTLLPQESALFRFPGIDLGLPAAVVAPIAAIGLILVLGGAAMIIFVVRRSRNREVESG